MGPMDPRLKWAQQVLGPNGPKWVPGPNSENLSVVVFVGRIAQANKIDMAMSVTNKSRSKWLVGMVQKRPSAALRR